GLSAKEGIIDAVSTLDDSKALSVLKTGTKVLGTTLGVVSAVSSGIDFYQSPTVANGVKLVIDLALIPAGPVAGVVGGLAEATGVKDAVANSIQDIADDYLIHEQ